MLSIILILILLTLVNGFFSMSEISVLSARKFKLENAARKGSLGAKKAMELAEHPNRFLSTVQIGITLIGIWIGLYSGEKLAEPLAAVFATVPALVHFADEMATAIVLLATTYVSIVLGELFPKRIGLSFPDRIAAIIALPMYWLARLAAPLVWLLTKTNELLLRLLGINSGTDDIVTEEEIRSMLSESAESGQIEEIEQEIVERVFALGDRKVSSLMTHRSDLVWLDKHDTVQDVLAKMGAEIHNAYPVCDDEIDNILGIVTLKDLFHHLHTKAFDLEKMVTQPIYTPPGMPAYKVLDHFRDHRQHCALVIDEFGSLQGMVTMDDILDALLGDVSDADQTEYSMQENGPNIWVADGRYPFFEFLRYMELDESEFLDEDFSTVAGFIIAQLDKIPIQGERLEWRGFLFEVLAMEGRRIEKVRISKSE